MAQFEEPPVLQDSEGNPIVQFRRPDGTIFSNHPEYGYAKAVYEQQQLRAAEVADSEVEDDVPEEPDNGDGTVSYEEMTSHDLAAEAQRRKLTLSDRKRSTVIKALQDDDAAKAEADS